MTLIPESGPLRLIEIFSLLDENVDYADKEVLKTMELSVAALNPTLGRWLRNNARLWTDGTDLVVEDVMRLKTVFLIPSLDGFKEPGQIGIENGIDYSLFHPDNISHVVLSLYVQRLNDELTDDILKILDTK